MSKFTPLEDAQEEAFCHLIAGGATQGKAFKGAFPEKCMGITESCIRNKAAYTRSQDRIKSRIIELQAGSKAAKEILHIITKDDPMSKKDLLAKLKSIIDSPYSEARDVLRAIELTAKITGVLTTGTQKKITATQINNTLNVNEGEDAAKKVDILGNDSSMRLQQAFQLHLAKSRQEKTVKAIEI